MSYAASVALQSAVYLRLRDDEALTALVGDAIYDAMPVEAPCGVYVSLGPEDVREAGDMTGDGSRHDFIVSVLSGTDETGGSLRSNPLRWQYARLWSGTIWSWSKESWRDCGFAVRRRGGWKTVRRAGSI